MVVRGVPDTGVSHLSTIRYAKFFLQNAKFFVKHKAVSGFFVPKYYGKNRDRIKINSKVSSNARTCSGRVYFFKLRYLYRGHLFARSMVTPIEGRQKKASITRLVWETFE